MRMHAAMLPLVAVTCSAMAALALATTAKKPLVCGLGIWPRPLYHLKTIIYEAVIKQVLSYCKEQWAFLIIMCYNTVPFSSSYL